MIKDRIFTGLVALVMMVSAFSLHAEMLEPVLRAVNVVGTVQVQKDGKGDFMAIQDGKTYPYGSRFRAGPESSVSLALSSASEVKVLANTDMIFDEGTRDKNEKTVRLLTGEVEADLATKFGEGGNVLNIQAGKTIAQAVGTLYRVAIRRDGDVYIVVIRSLEGTIRVLGENFEIAELQGDEWVSLVSPPDDSFMRLKVLRGDFEVTVKDEDKTDRSVAVEKESVVKIWQRIVPGTGERVISAVFSDPEGELVETIRVTFGPGEYADFVQVLMDDDGEFPWAELEDAIRSVRRTTDEEGDNPVPPDNILDQFVVRMLEDLNAGIGSGIIIILPPTTPTPTPVGNT